MFYKAISALIVVTDRSGRVVQTWGISLETLASVACTQSAGGPTIVSRWRGAGVIKERAASRR